MEPNITHNTHVISSTLFKTMVITITRYGGKCF